MADNIPITPGSGKTVATDDVGGIQYQRVKLDVGDDGVSKPVIQGGTDGLPVDVLSVAGDVSTKPKVGQVWPVNDNGSTISVDDGGSSLTVDAPVGSPAFVRLSDGSSPISTLPVSGSVTGAQGTAASNSGAWPTKISDGTDAVGITDVSGAKALKVDVLQLPNSVTAPVWVQTTPQGRTRVTKNVSITGSQAGTAIWTPNSGKRFVITSIELTISVSGTFTLFDSTNAAGSIVVDGTQPTGAREMSFGGVPWESSGNDQILKYTTGSGTTGVIAVHGYER